MFVYNGACDQPIAGQQRSKGSGEGQTWHQENEEDALNEANLSILDLLARLFTRQSGAGTPR